MPNTETDLQPPRLAASPRYRGERYRIESWDISLADLGGESPSPGRGGLWIRAGIVSNLRGQALGTCEAIRLPAPDVPPVILRGGTPDPHLGLAPPYLAAFDDETASIISNWRLASASALPGELESVGAGLLSAEGRLALEGNSCSGELARGGQSIAWDLNWDAGEGSALGLPSLQRGRELPFQCATRLPAARAEGRVVIDGDVMPLESAQLHFTHSFGKRWPRAWASLSVSEWEFADLAPQLSAVCDGGVPTLLVSWIRGGVFGYGIPPMPKTFGRLLLGKQVTSFAGWGRALTSYSTLRWPVWEARLISSDLKVRIRSEFDPDEVIQVEQRNPAGGRIWRTVGTSVRCEAALEVKSNGRWIGAGSLATGSAHLDYGGRHPDYHQAVID